jgi:type II secretory pathway component PulM
VSRVWRTVTLRERLTLWYAGALVCVLLAYAAGVFFFLERSLWQQLDIEETSTCAHDSRS